MPRTISDDDWNLLQTKKAIADFIEPIYNDPALSKDAKRLIKKKYPNVAIPDFDLEEKFESARAADKKAIEDKEKAAADKKQRDAWKADRDRVQKEYGFTDEGMTALEKLMTERNVADYEVAATYHAAKNPKPSDPNYSHHGEPWGHGASDTFKEIARDPEGWGRTEIMKAIRADQERARQAR